MAARELRLARAPCASSAQRSINKAGPEIALKYKLPDLTPCGVLLPELTVS
jgi:hypothetical protein